MDARTSSREQLQLLIMKIPPSLLFACSTGYTRVHPRSGQHVSDVSELEMEGIDKIEYLTLLHEQTGVVRQMDVAVTLSTGFLPDFF